MHKKYLNQYFLINSEFDPCDFKILLIIRGKGRRVILIKEKTVVFRIIFFTPINIGVQRTI